MKITIDTKEDSREEIRKAIRMLSSIVGEPGVYCNESPEKQHNPNIFSDNTGSAQQAQSVFGSLFGDTQQSQQENPPKEKQSEEKKPEIEIIY